MKTMAPTPIRHHPVEDRSAWNAAQLAADPSAIYLFDQRGLDALDALCTQVKTIDITDIRKKHFDISPLKDDLAHIRQQLEFGTGVVLLRGLPAADYSKEEMSKIYWALGLHIGVPVCQNGRGHFLGHVRNEGVKYSTAVRGYNSTANLNFHCDNADVVGLLCLRKAKAGGESRIVSSMAIFNKMLERRPDLLRPLFDGFHYHLKGENVPGRSVLTDHRIPVFDDCEGTLSCRYLRNAITPAFQALGSDPTPEQTEALDMMDELAQSEELVHHMMMEPGDMQLLNNHTVLHARGAFEDHDDEDRKRHLLRLWLRTDVRPLNLHFAERFGPGTARFGTNPNGFQLEGIEA